MKPKRWAVAALTAAALTISLGAGVAEAKRYNVTAHGGVHSKERSANTIPAVALAKKRGFTCAETDLRQTKATAESPMRMVGVHDSDASHLTNAPPGTIIENTTWKELKQYRYDSGHRIPTVEQYMRWADRHGNYCILAEIKDFTPASVWTPGEFRYLQRLAVRHGLANRFHLEIPRQVHLLMAKENAPRLPVTWKLKNEWPSNATFREMSIDAVIPRWGGVYRQHVIIAHRLGIKLYGGVTNKIERFRKIVRIGADGTISGGDQVAIRFFNRGTRDVI